MLSCPGELIFPFASSESPPNNQQRSWRDVCNSAIYIYSIPQDKTFRSDSLKITTTQFVEAYFSTRWAVFFCSCLCSSTLFIPQFLCVPPFQFHRHTSHQSSFTVSLNQTYTRHTILFRGVQFVVSLVWYLRFLRELSFQYKIFGNVKFCGEYKNVSMKKVSSLSCQLNIQKCKT